MVADNRIRDCLRDCLRDRNKYTPSNHTPEIQLILGAYPDEPHILNHIRKHPHQIIYCANQDDYQTQDDYQADNYIKLDFNSRAEWDQLASIFSGQISQIIFDSSTVKFISDSDEMWNLDQRGFEPIHQILKPGGKLFCDSNHTGCLAYQPDETGIILGTLPFCDHSLVQIPFSPERLKLTADQKFNLITQSDGFAQYLRSVRAAANQHGFEVEYHDDVNDQAYPLARTNYSITQYIVWEKW